MTPRAKVWLANAAVVALAVLATILGQFLAASAAGAATAHHDHRTLVSSLQSHHIRADCRPTVTYDFHTQGTPQGGETQWTQSCGDQQRVKIRCWDQLDNTTSTYRGGWVYSMSIVSGQNCHRLGEELVKFGWQARVGPGNPALTTWIWTRPGFNPVKTVTTAMILHRTTRATGPFFIKTQSAPVCLKVSPDAVGTLFTQGAYSVQNPDCRKLFFSREGFINGHPFGEYQTAHPVLDLSAGSTCTDVFLARPGSTGIVWVQYIAEPARQYLINRHCNSILGGGTNCVAALSADGTVGHEWFIEPLGKSGWFQRIHQIQTSDSTGHVHTRAGC